MTTLPAGWILSASAFNLTPTVIAARHDAPAIAATLIVTGISTDIEVELGQLWRAFPHPTAAEGHALRDELAALGGRVSIVGASIDDWAAPDRRRSDEERYDFLLPQVQVAAALGATGLRLPLGQAGPDLLRRLLPVLADHDLVLFEEAQGPGSPDNPHVAAAYDTLAQLDDPHLRLLVDISMLMPALPVTYLERLEASALPADLVRRLRDEWADPATTGAVVETLRAGLVPAEIHTLYMNLLVRFGRSPVEALAPVADLISAVHLKFWDLDDADGRITRPIHDLAGALSGTGFAGTLCSEWGGQEWLDDDPLQITAAHLTLAAQALGDGHRAGAPDTAR